MWAELPTITTHLDCRPPFSFYFDLIEVYWKARDANSLPFHRICTLARKQGAQSVVVESGLARPEVRADIDALDKVEGGGGAAEAVCVSYFNSSLTPDQIPEAGSGSFLGQVTLINYRRPGSSSFDRTYIFEAIFPPPSLRSTESRGVTLLNNYLSVVKEFEREVNGHLLSVQGIYYCQQNSMTHVCAHACLRMILNTLSENPSFVSSSAINTLLGINLPCNGLTLGQINHCISNLGKTNSYIINCDELTPQTYISALASFVESGIPALLVFTTANAEEHVVTVFGHTRNSDQWHPQAIPAYGGPQSATYYPGSAWISHFLIHDDNFGPYYTLSSRALDVDPNVRAHWIVPVLANPPSIPPHFAEAIGAAFLSNNLSTLAPLGKGRWFDYITRSQWRYVLRTTLLDRQEYIDHLAAVRSHDQSQIAAAELTQLATIPDRLWMVEFSLPALFTGNRSKLGEVIIDAQASLSAQPFDSVQSVRLPSLLLVRDPSGKFNWSACSLDSHCSLHRRGHSGPEW